MFHKPVLVEQSARFLITRLDGVYVDMTCGGGGHLEHFTRLLARAALLVGIDRDPEAVYVARETLGQAPQKIEIVNSSFDRIDEIMRGLGIATADGFLFDLGLSSRQIDSPERGFSFMHDGPLDMRMDRKSDLTAEKVVNDYSEKELAAIFTEYGEERRARQAARAVCVRRKDARITTTGMLTATVAPVLSPRYRNASLARLFQALRIEVNGELDQLREALPRVLERLAVGGRAVVISYHSLEDRIVKRFLSAEARGCTCPKDIPVCVCGGKPTVRVLTKRVVKPSPDEVKENVRARSARLRAAEKIA
ncbi:MAG: 16S rRNA (cytosine(1402)-N(4))-methyltransferase RsmH [Candidatus Zixiibacteriota bacterium]|nr:MAG: 16S rRNA (cytosine(1402)-N(4))-methyltransferase RsmH [candidate division Zixibacteria bacterium]